MMVEQSPELRAPGFGWAAGRAPEMAPELAPQIAPELTPEMAPAPSGAVRHIVAGEHDRLRELRLTALASDPDVFASTHARDAARPIEWWERWARESELGATQRTFVLEGDHGRWMGLALVELDDRWPGCAILNAMWVSPKARGRGASRRLCDACAGWASARGCRELRLAVVVDNVVAQRAYAAAGFTVLGDLRFERDGRTLDELLMARPL